MLADKTIAAVYQSKMNSIKRSTGVKDMKERLSLLWVFYMFNAAYIDITTLYYSVFINHSRPFITLRPSCWEPVY